MLFVMLLCGSITEDNMKKLHKWLGYKFYRYMKEPRSTRQPPQYSNNLLATQIVKRILGLHYYI